MIEAEENLLNEVPLILSEDTLLRRIPPVLRARDFRLYTQGGRRLLDLWQFGGAAVLGHTPPGLLRELKNTAERGLFTAFPHPMENRFTKALARLFPGTQCRIYADEAALCRALAEAGYTPPFPDPALIPRAAAGAALSLWRPFLDDIFSIFSIFSIQAEQADSALLIPVLPWALAPKVLVIPESFESVHRFRSSDLIAPVILGAAARSVYDLIAAGSSRGKAAFPKIQEALLQSTWRRRGIYLYYAEPLDDTGYAELFHRFLDQGFLLPPSRNLPAILPGIMSPGEEAKLARLLRS